MSKVFQFNNVIIDPEQVEFCHDYQQGVMVHFKSGNHTFVYDTNVKDFQVILIHYLDKKG